MLRSKNEWGYTSTPQYAFMAWCSVKAQRRLYLYLCLSRPSGPSGFQTKIHSFLISPMRPTCLAPPILLNLVTLIIIGEVCKLCSVLQPPATSPILDPNILLSMNLKLHFMYAQQQNRPWYNISVGSVVSCGPRCKGQPMSPHAPHVCDIRYSQM
jgi:hypothetical protein